MSNEVLLTADNFKKEVLESNIPVLVDFWAAWCVPCKMMDPILNQLAADYAGKLKVGTLNVDDQGDIATQYNIVSLPTMMLFQKGQVVDKRVGAVPRQVLEEFVKNFV